MSAAGAKFRGSFALREEQDRARISFDSVHPVRSATGWQAEHHRRVCFIGNRDIVDRRRLPASISATPDSVRAS